MCRRPCPAKGGEKEKTMKTYYTVNYATWGADSVGTATFDSKAAAYEFYNTGEYRDKPLAHSVSRQDKIDQYDLDVAMTAFEMRRD